MKLSELLYHIYDTPLYNDPEIAGLTLDSREVKPGYLFFAIKGTKQNGSDYINQAINNGAAAVLMHVDSENIPIKIQNDVPILPVRHVNQIVGRVAEQFYGNPSKKLKIAGVTGTNGKTSCSFFIAQALQYAQIPCGIIGTLGNGFYGNIKPGRLTTPDAVTLHALFAELVKEKAQALAMEVSSHSIDQGRINGIEFEVGIFTNLTRDHLDYHGTMEEYGAAKRKLFDNPLTKYAVINADDEFGTQLIKTLNHKNIYAYSVKQSSFKGAKIEDFIYADQIKLGISGIHATVYTPWGKGDIHVPLIGQFNLSNVLATLTTLCLLNVPFEIVLDSISHLSSVPGRMQTLGGKDQPLVVVDYAHTPDALEKVLSALKAHCKGKLYCVFGCGGDRDRGKRPIMAKIAEAYSDQIIVTDDNPRTEDPEQIVSEIMSGFKKQKNIIVQHDRSKAIRDIIQYAKARDCVLIAGKGAETYQEIGDKKIPFSDVEKVKESLHSC